MELRCPIDGSELQRGRVHERPIGTCERCHGLWISGMARFETDLPPTQIPRDARRTRGKVVASEARDCPWCRGPMKSERHAGVTIELCSHCGSVWLDAGEFDSVRNVLITRGPLPPAMVGEPDPSRWSFVSIELGALLQAICDWRDRNRAPTG